MFYDFSTYTNFRQIVHQRLSEAPDTPLFVHWDARHAAQTAVLPAEFEKQVEAVGAFLLQKGFQGKRLAILGENSYWWILTFFAIVTSGNIAVLLDKSLPADTLTELLRRTNCDALFCSEEYRDVAEDIRKSLPLQGFCLDSVLQLAQTPKTESFRHAYQGLSVDPGETAVICFTSGTSGEQKGVMLSQRNICEDVSHSGQIIDYSGNTLLLLPLHHMFGLSAGMLGTMVSRGTVFINRSLRYLGQDLAAVRPSVLPVVPAMLPPLYAAFSRIPFNPDLRLICGGAPVAQNWIGRFRELGIRLFVGYGMTECAPMIAVDSELFQRFDTSMRPVPGTDVLIDDPDAAGCGEILVRGSHVMQGYDQMPEQTAAALEGGWFHTGDIGCLDASGFLKITGRKKNLLILENGENVPAEVIEQGLMQLPGVSECLSYVEEGVLSAAIYAPDAQEDAVRAAVQDWNRTLPSAHRIVRLTFRSEEFPKNASQKILRFGF